MILRTQPKNILTTLNSVPNNIQNSFIDCLTLNMEVLSALMLISAFICGETTDTVNLNQGRIIGSVLKSRAGRVFEAFQGIPYAEPPVGDLRLKDPVPARSWHGVFNATTEPPICMQKNLFLYKTYQDIIGVEDCLYLNVYTPKAKKEERRKSLPVMVWIPGGGFSSGSGGLSSYGPQYLLDKDIVLVSINYRVGAFGFLSTEDDVLPGNYGLKDQVLALKWVKNNIENFGGDPERVTIFGQSAGAVSVGLHLLSPLSKGLFHKAIMESGTPLCRWAITPPGWARRRALTLSTIYGCPENSRKLVDCFKNMPADVLVDLHYKLFEWEIFPSITLAPVAENCNKNNGSFLCNYPLLGFTQESKVPVLIGMNSGEGGLFVSRVCNSSGHIDTRLKKYFANYISSLIIYKYTTKISDIPKVGTKLLDRYIPDGDFDANVLNLVKMVTGGLFVIGTFDMATNLSSPVYYYVYDHLNAITFNTQYGPCPKKLGVTHADETISLFQAAGQPELVGEDLKVSNLMVDIWTRFASSDQLTVDGQRNGTKWPVFDAKDTAYVLVNSSNPVVSKKPYLDEFTFWNDLPILSRLNKDD